eukprot:SRR837773.2680.p1 GENE.SRR837773.2680~~SRR837773.2680.p1  ORF type:complete len:297 (-),score=52.53 SRR837773.2680:47-814(-)
MSCDEAHAVMTSLGCKGNFSSTCSNTCMPYLNRITDTCGPDVMDDDGKTPLVQIATQYTADCVNPCKQLLYGYGDCAGEDEKNGCIPECQAMLDHISNSSVCAGEKIVVDGETFDADYVAMFKKESCDPCFIALDYVQQHCKADLMWMDCKKCQEDHDFVKESCSFKPYMGMSYTYGDVLDGEGDFSAACGGRKCVTIPRDVATKIGALSCHGMGGGYSGGYSGYSGYSGHYDSHYGGDHYGYGGPYGDSTYGGP